MVDILGLAEIPLPGWGIGTGKVTIVLSIFIFAIVGMIVVWLIYQWRIYNRKIIVFENISGQGFQVSFKDKARIITVGDGGEEVLFLRKKKKYRTAYGRKMGKNTYWFAVGQDGYWYNVVLGDVDAKMGMLDIEPIDRDMRYMHVAIRKNIADRYKSKKVLTATAIVVGGIVVTVLIVIIGNYFLLDKIADIAAATSGNIDAAETVNRATQQILSSLDNICSGSGIRPAG